MNYVTSVAERTIVAVDYFLNRAMVFAWEATLRRQQPAAEEDYGGGDICSLPEATSTDDDQPLG
jgi:hypothetical protein